MAELLPQIRQRFFDSNGEPLAGGKLYSYEAETTTPRATYADFDGVVPNENPVILDADGYADICIKSGSYKFILTDANDQVLWTRDKVPSIAAIINTQGALAVANNLSDLENQAEALTNLGIGDLPGDVSTLETALTTHIDATTNAHHASAILTDNASMAATNVQDALQELWAEKAEAEDLSNHRYVDENAHPASTIYLSPNIDSHGNVQAALQSVRDHAVSSGNPHNTTGADVGSDIAQWNANKIQGNDMAVPAGSSMLDVQSTTKGSRPFPRMTETQRDAITTPATGLIIYNTDTNKVNVFDGAAWGELSGGGGGAGSGGVNYNTDPYFNDASKVWTVQGTSDPGASYQIDPANTAIHGPALPGAFILRKTATNQVARGFGYTFDIGPDAISRGYVILKLKYTAETASLAAGDVKLTLLDPDNIGNTVTIAGLTDGLLGAASVGGVETLLGKVHLYPGQTRLFVAPTWWTSDTIAKGFIMSGLSIGPEGSQAVTYENYAEISLAGSGVFTGGKIAVSRYGRNVTISVIETATFASNNSPASAEGLIPSWAIPAQEKWNTFSSDSTGIYHIRVQSNGAFRFFVRDYVGNAVSKTSIDTTGSASYTVSDNRSSLISTTEAMNRSAQVYATFAAGSHTVTGAWQTVTNFNNVRDLTGGFNSSTGVFTAPKSAVFGFLGGIGFGNSANGKRGAGVYNTTTSSFLGKSSLIDAGANDIAPLSVGGFLEKGQQAVIQGYQNSGGSLAYIADGTVSMTIFEIQDLTTYGVYQEPAKRVSSYNATRVLSTAPTTLGEYRPFRRNASAVTLTETGALPATLPNATDGFFLYAGNGWGTADSSSNPTRYDIFVGKNKKVQFEFYQSAGKTNPFSPQLLAGGTTSYGTNYGYDPTTGIASVQTAPFTSATTANRVGLSIDGSAVITGYFDILVSER